MLLETFIDLMIAAILAMYSPSFIEKAGDTMNAADYWAFSWAIIAIIICVLFAIILVRLSCKDFHSDIEREQVDKEIKETNTFIEYYNRLADGF